MQKIKENIFDKVKRGMNPTLAKGLKATRKHNLTIINEHPDVKQAIYVANHYDSKDIPVALESIDRHSYVLISDEDRFTPGGIMLSINGALWLNRRHKKSRQKAAKKVLKHLAKGHNILIYPEATWNLSPNLLMLPMNYGVIGFSLETNVPIIPIGTYYKDNNYYVKFGEPFYPGQTDYPIIRESALKVLEGNEKSIEAIRDLRDQLATLRIELMENFPIANRQELANNYWEEDIARRYNAYKRGKKDPAGVKKYESQFIFRDKKIITPEEAFSYINPVNNNEEIVKLLVKK